MRTAMEHSEMKLYFLFWTQWDEILFFIKKK